MAFRCICAHLHHQSDSLEMRGQKAFPLSFASFKGQKTFPLSFAFPTCLSWIGKRLFATKEPKPPRTPFLHTDWSKITEGEVVKPLVNTSHYNDHSAIKPVTWNPSMRRIGALALKVGMINYFDKWGQSIPITILLIDDCRVLGHELLPSKGNSLSNKNSKLATSSASIEVQIAIARKKPWNLSRSRSLLFEKFQVPAKKDVFSFCISPECLLPPGWSINAAHFVPGQHVDIKGKSIGKGFQGVVKRWGFAGMPATHGTSLKHRTGGSIGTKGRARVMKGKKMPGKMGNKPMIVYNLQVVKVDTSLNCLYVKGHVPGHRNGTVWIRDSIGQEFFHSGNPPPCPTFLPTEAVPRFLEMESLDGEKDPLHDKVSEKM